MGHKAGEDGVAGILGGGGQDAHIHILVDVEHIAYLLRQHSPLVVAEVVDNDEKYLLLVVEQRKHLALEDVGTHQRTLGGSGLNPVHIVAAYKLGKSVVGLFLLHLKHLRHVGVGGA